MFAAAFAVLTLLAAPASTTKTAPAKPVAAAKPAAKPLGFGRFSRWIEDLPLMPGMAEAPGGYSFEIFQGGRLAEARLTGAQNPQVVESFYAATLPALGWRRSPTESYAWLRGRERLIVHVSKTVGAKPGSPDRGSQAVFALSPEGPAKPPAVSAPKDVL